MQYQEKEKDASRSLHDGGDVLRDRRGPRTRPGRLENEKKSEQLAETIRQGLGLNGWLCGEE